MFDASQRRLHKEAKEQIKVTATQGNDLITIYFDLFDKWVFGICNKILLDVFVPIFDCRVILNAD